MDRQKIVISKFHEEKSFSAETSEADHSSAISNVTSSTPEENSANKSESSAEGFDYECVVVDPKTQLPEVDLIPLDKPEFRVPLSHIKTTTSTARASGVSNENTSLKENISSAFFSIIEQPASQEDTYRQLASVIATEDLLSPLTIGIKNLLRSNKESLTISDNEEKDRFNEGNKYEAASFQKSDITSDLDGESFLTESEKKKIALEGANKKEIALEGAKKKELALEEAKEKELALKEPKEKELALEETKEREMDLEETEEKKISLKESGERNIPRRKYIYVDRKQVKLYNVEEKIMTSTTRENIAVSEKQSQSLTFSKENKDPTEDSRKGESTSPKLKERSSVRRSIEDQSHLTQNRLKTPRKNEEQANTLKSSPEVEGGQDSIATKNVRSPTEAIRGIKSQSKR